MDRKLERLESKIDAIQESVHNIDKTMAINTESLIAHMSRTKLLEKIVFMTLVGLGTLGVVLLSR